MSTVKDSSASGKGHVKLCCNYDVRLRCILPKTRPKPSLFQCILIHGGHRVHHVEYFVHYIELYGFVYTLRFVSPCIKMDLQEVEGGRGDWMELAQDRDRWWALVGTVRDFRVP